MTVTEPDNFTQSDRFIKVKEPQFAPGCCFFCRKPPGADIEFFIDLRMQTEHPVGIEMDGGVYMCSQCLDFIARLGGYKKSTDVSKLAADYQQAVKDLHRAEQTVIILNGIVNDLTRAGYNLPDNFAQHTNHQLDAAGVDFRFDAEPDEPDADDSSGGKEGPDESSDDEGVAELHSSGDKPIFSFGEYPIRSVDE